MTEEESAFAVRAWVFAREAGNRRNHGRMCVRDSRADFPGSMETEGRKRGEKMVSCTNRSGVNWRGVTKLYSFMGKLETHTRSQ